MLARQRSISAPNSLAKRSSSTTSKGKNVKTKKSTSDLNKSTKTEETRSTKSKVTKDDVKSVPKGKSLPPSSPPGRLPAKLTSTSEKSTSKKGAKLSSHPVYSSTNTTATTTTATATNVTIKTLDEAEETQTRTELTASNGSENIAALPSLGATVVEDLEQSDRPVYSAHSPNITGALLRPRRSPPPDDLSHVRFHANALPPGCVEEGRRRHNSKSHAPSSTSDEDDEEEDSDEEADSDEDEEDEDDEDEDEDEEDEDDEEEEDEEEDEGRDGERNAGRERDEDTVDPYVSCAKTADQRRRQHSLTRITVKVSREGDRNVKVLFITKKTKFKAFVKDIMRRFSYSRVNGFDMYCIDASGDHVDIDVPKDFKDLTARFWQTLHEEEETAARRQPSRRFAPREAVRGSASLSRTAENSTTVPPPPLVAEDGDRSSSTVLRLYVRDSYKARLRAERRRVVQSPSLPADSPHLARSVGFTNPSANETPLVFPAGTGSAGLGAQLNNLCSGFSVMASHNLSQTIGFREDEEVQWTKMAMLGKGTFGSVYEGITSDGRIMAVKVQEIPLDEDAEELQAIKHEINLMRSLKHRNIVAYYGCQTRELPNGQRQLEIFLEHCHGGSLSHLRRKFERAKERFSISLVRAYARQILEGLHYLHSMNVVHRDLKSDNVLISALGEAKLADFGCSKRIGTAQQEAGGGHGGAGFQTMVGTPLFMAPEVLCATEGGYSKPADVWSVGCLLLELLGRVPWALSENANAFQIMFHISKSTDMPTGIPKKCPPALYDFFKKCFTRVPAKRSTAEELLKHEWITCPDSKLDEVPDD